MDLGLNEQQQMLRDFARDFLEKECPESLVRAMEEDERGYSPELWRKMAEQGWMGLIIPEAYGGAGLSFCELAVLLEEFGRALVPGPYIPTVVDAAIPILEFGSAAQKRELLPKIASGQLVLTLALTEPSARWDAQGIQLQATPEGEGYVLNGTKLFVQDAHVSDAMVVVARTRQDPDPEEGITCFIVDGKSPGLATATLKTIALDRQCEVSFQNVRVPASAVLGQVDQGWQVIESLRPKATVARCAYLVGLSQMDFDISLGYAKERIQFGRPIGSFQAIQHKCADMIIDVDGARFITYKAAWCIAENEPDAELNASMAKAWVAEASRRVVAQGQQLHGGIGFTKDYKIQLFFRRQKWMELMWGDADYHREQVARLLSV